jgi:hypothetical protein
MTGLACWRRLPAVADFADFSSLQVFPGPVVSDSRLKPGSTPVRFRHKKRVARVFIPSANVISSCRLTARVPAMAICCNKRT